MFWPPHLTRLGGPTGALGPEAGVSGPMPKSPRARAPHTCGRARAARKNILLWGEDGFLLGRWAMVGRGRVGVVVCPIGTGKRRGSAPAAVSRTPDPSLWEARGRFRGVRFGQCL